MLVGGGGPLGVGVAVVVVVVVSVVVGALVNVVDVGMGPDVVDGGVYVASVVMVVCACVD